MSSRLQVVGLSTLGLCATMVAAAFGQPSEVEGVSFLGAELRRLELPEAFAAEQERLLAKAREELAASPNDPDALIWVGRRTAYLGRYREALEIYSEGIQRHPGYAPLYRHRGHRYISLRRLDEAIADLEEAARLVARQPDEIEPDGLPNALGIPTSTLQSNIYYHLGLAHYLAGDFDSALDAYRADLEVSTNPDSLAATSYWLYLTLRRLGEETAAASVLEPIVADLDVIENHEYHRLLLVYKGELGIDELLTQVTSDDGSLESATVGYGLGAWFLVNGDRDRAREVFEQIVEGGQWPAFGFLAAEAELARWTGGGASP